MTAISGVPERRLDSPPPLAMVYQLVLGDGLETVFNKIEARLN
jgi:hypothetical protein